MTLRGYLVWCGICLPILAWGQEGGGLEQDLVSLPIEQLLTTEVSSVLKHPSELADAPAATTVLRREDIERMSDIALQSGQTLLNLLNDILDLSKIEAGKLEMEHTPFDLGALADRNLLTLVENAQAKGLDLTVRLGAEVPALVMGDPNRLGQVLCNLLGNAVKFTEQGFVALEVERRPGGEGGKAEIRFLVKDSGIGISPAEQQRLFQAFTQADASTTRKFGGTGLGLAISRELVRLMGGELTLVSAPGEGSEFSFSLILPVVQEACRPGPSAYRRMQHLSQSSRRHQSISGKFSGCQE